LNEESQHRRPKRRRGFWHFFAGPLQEQSDPLPDSIAAILLRIESGQPLTSADFRRLGGVVGRRSVRLLEGLIHGAVVRDGSNR
jgi:hypothetical protein